MIPKTKSPARAGASRRAAGYPHRRPLARAGARVSVSIRDRSQSWYFQLRERESELEHERRLAEIRTQSHALVWTGTPEELTATITHWVEAGWIVAADLPEALRKASLHFVRPDGVPIIAPSVLAALQPSPEKQKPLNARQLSIFPRLDEKGWSPLRWAAEADVAHDTVIDYLANKTRPHRKTRVKLARALGISVQELPR